MKKFFKYSNYLYFVVAILSLIAYFTKKDMDNNFWLIMFLHGHVLVLLLWQEKKIRTKTMKIIKRTLLSFMAFDVKSSF